MLVRQKIQNRVIKCPNSTAREISKALGMSDGAVAGQLNHMEKAGFVVRTVDENNVSRWSLGSTDDKNYAKVTYVGNHHYRVYLDSECAKFAGVIAGVLRKVMPELKYARAFTETVRVPVRRNKLIKL